MFKNLFPQTPPAMSLAFRHSFALAALSLFVAGCASTPDVDEPGGAPEEVRFTPLPGVRHWMTASELPTDGRIVIALADIDATRPEVVYSCAAAACSPDGGDSLVLTVLEDPVSCPTLLALRNALDHRTEEPPFGLVVTAGGRPLGGGTQVTPEMAAFLRYFVSTLDDAGLRYAFIVPERLIVVRGSAD